MVANRKSYGAEGKAIATVIGGKHEFALIHCANGAYAITQDGWIRDDRRWEKGQIDDALSALVEVAGGHLDTVVLRNHSTKYN